MSSTSSRSESLSKYLARIQSAFPNLSIQTTKVIEDGFVNNVVIVNDERVFRFPKNADWALKLFQQELAILGFLKN